MAEYIPSTTRSIEYDYKYVPTISRFSKSNKFKRGIIGPFGSGKSSGMIMEIVRRAVAQVPSPIDGVRRSRWAAVRNSYPQLRDTTIKTVHDWFPPKLFGLWKVTDHDYIITNIPAPDGSKVELTIMFRALDKPEHVSNLLSMELTGAWFNEAREIPKVIVDAMEGRVGRFPSKKEGGCTWSGIIMDTNPPDTDHWWFKMFEEDPAENTEIFHQPSGLSEEAENLPNLPPYDGTNGYYTNMAQGKDDNFIKVYVKGEYGYSRDGKPVYSNYKDAMHCAPKDLDPIPGLPLVLGFDFGLTPSCIIAQFTPKGQLRVLDELVSDNMGIRRFAQTIVRPLLLTRYRGYKVVGSGDPAGVSKSPTDERTCFMELKEAGLDMVPAPTNSILGRISSVDFWLTRLSEGEPGFLLSPRCRVLRKGFIDGYRYRRMQISGQDIYTTEPDKNEYSHPHDALQYLCLYIDKIAISSARRDSRRSGSAARISRQIAAAAYS